MLGIPGAEVFVGSPNRPNLVYRVVPKPDSAKATLSAMVSFIRDNFPGQCGIVYCLSRKDAEEVAHQLGEQVQRPTSGPASPPYYL
jgi:superfamily II DNA helicase RecQ